MHAPDRASSRIPGAARAVAAGALAGVLLGGGLCLTAGPALAAGAAGPAPAPAFERSLGGTGRGALQQPYGVAAGRDGSVWVADRAASKAEELTPSGQLIMVLGQHGPGALLQPEGVAVGPGGNVWVSDTGHDRIVEFAPDGAELRAFGSAGSGSGQLSRPRDLAVAPGGDVYVADQGNNRIEEFSPSGRYLASISVPTPYGVALDASADVWVSSPSYTTGSAVYELSPAGATLRHFGSTQASFGALSNPGGIAVGPGGRVYLTQPDYGLVTVFSAGGSFFTEFGLQASTRKARDDLEFPQDLTVTSDGSIWVADSGNGRIAEFGPASPAAAVAAGRPSGAGQPSRAGGTPGAVWLAIWSAVLAAVAGGLALAVRAGMRRRRRGRAVLRDVLPGPATAPAAVPAPATAPDPAGLPEPASTEPVSRRDLLVGATALTGAALGAGVLPLSLRRALAASLASPPRGGLGEIKHIVILMQENRSFDHYFGTMPGVRGFADPAAVRLPNGSPVFFQPDPSHPQGYLLPFRYDTRATSAQATPGTDHSWPTQHQAWACGKMDAWIAAKGEFTMGYFTQSDIPFHWALAQAFTVCDNYHCSVLGPTNPNRLHMWTGMLDPAGTGGGPIIANTPALDNVILSWTTYPERLQRAGISWQVYQEEDNFDDNALAWFKQYASAPASSPLRRRGIAFGQAGDFEADARNDALPQVSWLVAPTAQSEHPDYFPAAGAEYIAQKLDAIAANPQVWAKTAFILCYDENDGLFDHVVPPTPPAGTPHEFVHGLPIGLGFRTPTTIVSPWTAGGYVNSDVFDHTSLIRFIETRFGVHEPNISAWRRRTCGDLTSAFRFGAQRASYPHGNTRLQLASTAAGLLTAQQEVNDNPAPVIPAVNKPLPAQ